VCCGVCLLIGLVSTAAAQQVTVTAPMQNLSERFFERTGVSWELNGPNFFARFGNATSGLPPFGGFDPNAGLTTGFAIRGGDWTARLFMNASQGVQRTHTTVAPTITLQNGQPGFLIDQVQRPFVVGFVPVVGGGGSPLFSVPSPQVLSVSPALSLGSSQHNRRATRISRGDRPLKVGDAAVETSPETKGAPATAEAAADRNMLDRKNGLSGVPAPEYAEVAFDQLLAQDRRGTRAAGVRPRLAAATHPAPATDSDRSPAAEPYVVKGERAEAEGKLAVARIYFRMAANRSDGDVKRELLERIDKLEQRAIR
jgi:hypothetical protein